MLVCTCIAIPKTVLYAIKIIIIYSKVDWELNYYHNILYKYLQQTGFHYNDVDQIWLWIVLKASIVPYAVFVVFWSCENANGLILNFGNIEID